jgi:biotin carboxyl carrier protein
VEAGQTIAAGTPIGLIEVMKTFTHVTYQPRENLPPQARVVRMIAGDGADVREGEALLEIADPSRS